MERSLLINNTTSAINSFQFIIKGFAKNLLTGKDIDGTEDGSLKKDHERKAKNDKVDKLK